MFTGATRPATPLSCPAALALPDAFSVASIVIVTQTLVEIIGMVVYVRLVPRLLPAHD